MFEFRSFNILCTLTWKWRKKYKNCDKYGISSQVIENNNRLAHSAYWLGSKTSNKWKTGWFPSEIKRKKARTFLILRICRRKCCI